VSFFRKRGRDSPSTMTQLATDENTGEARLRRTQRLVRYLSSLPTSSSGDDDNEAINIPRTTNPWLDYDAATEHFIQDMVRIR
jgi:hypothetical protein